jgi:hypothetical protein
VGFSRRSIFVVVSFVVVTAVAVVAVAVTAVLWGGIAWFACGGGVLWGVGGDEGRGGEGGGGGVSEGRATKGGARAREFRNPQGASKPAWSTQGAPSDDNRQEVHIRSFSAVRVLV